jgi:hypothetical protein
MAESKRPVKRPKVKSEEGVGDQGFAPTHHRNGTGSGAKPSWAKPPAAVAKPLSAGGEATLPLPAAGFFCMDCFQPSGSVCEQCGRKANLCLTPQPTARLKCPGCKRILKPCRPGCMPCSHVTCCEGLRMDPVFQKTSKSGHWVCSCGTARTTEEVIRRRNCPSCGQRQQLSLMAADKPPVCFSTF